MPRPRGRPKASEGGPRSRYHVEALARGLQVLGAFTVERPRLTVKEIADLTGLLPSTVFRVVMTLVDLGYVEPEGKGAHYRLTIEPVLLGYATLSGLTLEELATPPLQRLQRETEESVFLSVLVETNAVDVISLRRPGMLSTLGQNYPLYCTPAGKALLAFLPEDRRCAILDRIELVPLAPRTLTSRSSLEAELVRIREQGFSLVDEELVPGSCGAGAPILGAGGGCVAAVAVSAAMSRISMERLLEDIVPRVRSTADQVAERLRWREIPAPPG